MPRFPKLTEAREALLEAWLARTLSTYPEEAARQLGSGGDPFANPVGQRLAKGLGEVIEGVCVDNKPARQLASALDEVVRVRAIQDFTPSAAVGFVLLLKGAAREVNGVPAEELRSFEHEVDELLLVAVDIYVACKSELFELRTRDMQRRTYHVVELANRLSGEAAAERQNPASSDHPEGGSRA